MAPPFYAPAGVAVNGGNLIVADYDDHVVKIISHLGTVHTLVGCSGFAGYIDGEGSLLGRLHSTLPGSIQIARFNCPIQL